MICNQLIFVVVERNDLQSIRKDMSDSTLSKRFGK